MTKELMLEALKDALGGSNQGLSDPVLYRYLTRAKNRAEDSTMLTFQASVPIIAAIGDKTFDLTDPLQFDLQAGFAVLDVLAVNHKDNPKALVKRSPSVIWHRRESNDWNGTPTMYAYHKPLNVPTLEIYLATNLASSGAVPTLVLDVKWRTNEISQTIDPSTPDYADEYIYTYAAVLILRDIGDDRKGDKKFDSKDLWHAMNNAANEASSGRLLRDWRES
jgi:hypothetical protein